MTNIVLNPVLALREYTWAVLTTNIPEVWHTSKYGGKIPIVPLNEEPELSEFSGPKIVYEYTTNESSPDYYRGSGEMTMAVLDKNFRRLTTTLNTLTTTFERHDESARDINEYLDRVPVFSGVSFGFVKVGFVMGGEPRDEEGGDQVGIINLRYDYFVDYSVNTRPTPVQFP